MESHMIRANFLKSKGFTPQCIFDIGAYKGEWTKSMKMIFPEANYVMFEANDKFKGELENEINDKTKVHIECLSNVEKEVIFYMNNDSKIERGDTSGSYYKENTIFYDNIDVIEKKIKTTTIDEIVKKNGYKNIDFIKLDTQGSELDILDGAKETLKNNDVKYILIETNIYEYNKSNPTITNIMTFMSDIGYSMYDIWELGYLNNNILMYFDTLFIKNFDRKIKGFIN